MEYKKALLRCIKLDAKLDVTATISEREAQNERLKNFIQILKKQDGVIKEFDSALWGSMVEYITVTFRNATEILA